MPGPKSKAFCGVFCATPKAKLLPIVSGATFTSYSSTPKYVSRTRTAFS